MSKKTWQTVEEFLANGGKIQVLPPGPTPNELSVSPSSKNAAAEMKTLWEAKELYGEQTKKKKKEKIISADDLSSIDRSKIPAELQFIFSKAEGVSK